MSELLLDEKILAIAGKLEDREIPHAFGGALALAYYATPRGTQDIDLNVFIEVARAPQVLAWLAELGVGAPSRAERARLEERGQIRVFWARTPVDVFFSYDPLHDSCMRRRRRVPFGSGEHIYVLSPEDLVVFKVLFDRRKDWDDIGELLYAQGGAVDSDYVQGWLRRILEPEDARIARFEELLAAER